MLDIIRDAPLGQFVNLVSRGRLLPYPDQRPSYVIPERLLPAVQTEPLNGASDPTLVASTRTPKSSPRASVLSGYPPESASYHSRTVTPQPAVDLERRKTESLPLRPLQGGQDLERGSSAQEPQRPLSVAGSDSGSSVNTETRKKREHEHWTKRMMRDPKMVKQEGLEDDYEFLVRWEGPNDPENPQNFSRAKKLFVSFQICLLTFSVYLGASLVASAETGLQEEFGVSRVVSVLPLSLYILGYGVGPMLWSPLQEIPHIGRMPVFVGCMFVFVIFQIPIVVSDSYAVILVFRFLTGFFGAPPLSGGGAALIDLYDSLHVPYALGVWACAAICGPILSPVIGGFAVMNTTWRFSIYELIFASGFAFIFTFLFLPETYGPTILRKRATRLRKLTGNDKLVTREELDFQDDAKLFQTIGTTIWRAFLLCGDPIVLFTNTLLAFVYGVFYLWFEAFPIVFTDKRGFNLGQSGLPFLAFYVSGALSLLVYILYQKYHYIPRLKREFENVPPEERLELALMGAPFIGVALLLFGWLGQYDSILWIGPTIGAAIYFPGVFYMFQCLSVYLALSYEQYAASILAGSALFRSLFGAGLPLVGHLFFTRLGVGGGSSLLAGVSFVFIAPLYYLYKNGPKLRARSRWIKKE
ncbi:MFS transporter [Sporobolomyces koalae]|uniref:MFS transporter n=1 Tax=Sporobolomyces koalae TaxID=500713 RepID=UPI0031742506